LILTRDLPCVNVSNVLSDDKKQQVIALGRLGWSLRRIEAAVHIRRETVAGYLRAMGIPVRPPGGWGKLDPAKAANEVITDFGAGLPPVTVLERKPITYSSASISAAYREAIESGLSQGRNAMAIWQDLVDNQGFSASYQSVQRFVRKLQIAIPPEARVVIETAPGEEGQVDYGSGPMVRDPQSGKYRRTRLFVMTLGYSRKCVRFLVFRSSVQVWADLHEKAFRRLGGATRVVVLDNLGEGVLAHAKKTPLKGQRFESLEEAQAYLDQWEERWADTRIHGTTKRQVAAMFAEERPSLLPLPLEPFRYYQYGEGTVHLDGCVEVEAAYYSAPPGWISRRVQVQWNGTHVRLIDPRTGQLLREHLRQQRGRHRIQDEDRPSRTPLSTEQLLRRAEVAGPHIGGLCQAMHRAEGQTAVRRIGACQQG
jgi:hypothetical protein